MYRIYKIINKINNKIYIGQTCKSLNKRWISHKCDSKNKNYYFYSAIRKYGEINFVMEEIDKCYEKDEADKLEKYYIKLYNSSNPKIGYNSTLGGEGGILTKKAIEKFSGINHYIIKPVLQYSLDGKFIKEYSYIKEASICLNIDRGKIVKTCKGERKSAGGYQWKYKKSNNIKQIISAYKKKINFGENNPYSKKVKQYSLSNNLLQIYNTIKEAGDRTKVNKDSISKNCRNLQKQAGGFIWKYA